MFERFTERSRRVIILSREEAGRFRHDFVGPEHLMLGLIRDKEGIAMVVLQQFGVDIKTLKKEMEILLADVPKVLTFGEVIFSKATKRILEAAIEEAHLLNHNFIGTEHLLLGILHEDATTGVAKILHDAGVGDRDIVRQKIVELFTGEGTPQSVKKKIPSTQKVDVRVPLQFLRSILQQYDAWDSKETFHISFSTRSGYTLTVRKAPDADALDFTYNEEE